MDGEQLQGSQWAKAGRRICGEYTVVLDAFQMDQEFITKCFGLQSFSSVNNGSQFGGYNSMLAI